MCACVCERARARARARAHAYAAGFVSLFEISSSTAIERETEAGIRDAVWCVAGMQLQLCPHVHQPSDIMQQKKKNPLCYIFTVALEHIDKVVKQD